MLSVASWKVALRWLGEKEMESGPRTRRPLSSIGGSHLPNLYAIESSSKANDGTSIAHGREVIEEIVKEELTKNPGPPGRFYPFMSGKIKVDSPLGKLLATKGITPENSNQFEGTANW